MPTSKLEMEKAICDAIIDTFENITIYDTENFEALEKAKDQMLQQSYIDSLNRRLSMEETRKIQNEIKLTFLANEYETFLAALGNNPEAMSIIDAITLKITGTRYYSCFCDLGLTLNPEFKMDSKTFFANYKIAKKKVGILEGKIELQRSNERGSLL